MSSTSPAPAAEAGAGAGAGVMHSGLLSQTLPASAAPKAGAAPHPIPAGMEADECPVDHSRWTAPTGGNAAVAPPVMPPPPEAAAAAQTATEVSHGEASEADARAGLNPLNNMPLTARQQPMPGQRMPLPTAREASSIPKGAYTPGHQASGEAAPSVWEYPSPQMFFNALRRKRWDAKEEDIPFVVAIHNAVNERSWQEVLRWEEAHKAECDCPRLARFIGRPAEPSPRAKLRTLLRGPSAAPFDRHDWIVDRCGTEVRYVIDFYRGPEGAANPLTFQLDVRPALDSLGAAVDRVRMQARTWLASLGGAGLGAASVEDAPVAPLPDVTRTGQRQGQGQGQGRGKGVAAASVGAAPRS